GRSRGAREPPSGKGRIRRRSGLTTWASRGRTRARVLEYGLLPLPTLAAARSDTLTVPHEVNWSVVVLGDRGGSPSGRSCLCVPRPGGWVWPCLRCMGPASGNGDRRGGRSIVFAGCFVAGL